MKLILLQYAMPLVAGYAFFLLISGRFQPMMKPEILNARPSWMLGLWFGLSVSLVTLLALQMVNPLAATELKPVLLPAAALLVMLVAPGIAVHAWYRSLIDREQESSWTQVLEQGNFDVADLDALALPPEPALNSETLRDNLDNNGGDRSRYDFDETLSASPALVPSDDVYDVAFEKEYNRLKKASSAVWNTDAQSNEQYNFTFDNELDLTRRVSNSGGDVALPIAEAPAMATPRQASKQLSQDMGNTAVATKLPASPLPGDTPEYTTAFDQCYERTVDALYQHAQLQLSIDAEPEQAGNPLDTEDFAAAFEESCQCTIEAITAEADSTVSAMGDTMQVIDSVELTPVASGGALDEQAEQLEAARIEVLIATELLSRERKIKHDYDLMTRRALQARQDETEQVVSKARETSRNEFRLRQEAEKHLRITRRALSRLESDVRRHESTEADQLIELEQQLEERIRTTAKAESALAREQKLRSDAERELVGSKQAVLAARRDARKNTAARAKVLATANKAIAFARHTVDARSKMQTEMQKLREQIKIHQATISSLIETLDNEKSKSREEVSYLSKQLMQKEIELEKKSIGAGNLTSRLVKKVARARPSAKPVS